MKNNTIQTLSDLQLIMAKFVHEIRNPLTIINCELQILLEKYPELADLKELTDMHEQLIFINNLIHEFSDYNNANKLTPIPVNMYDFLVNTVESFRPMFHYLGILLITEIPDNLPEIPVDPLRLRQAITNLLRNAEQAITHNNGKITVSAQLLSSAEVFTKCTTDAKDTLNIVFAQESDSLFENHTSNSNEKNPIRYLCISVDDNGCGIESDFFPIIGTPFATQKENGTGLGIPIIRQITEAHHGILKIQSIPSKGTTVSIYLPFTRMI